MTKLDEEWVKGVLPRRQPTDHKGRFGRLLLLCGSRQYRGAAALAAGGALGCGTGGVRLAAIEPVCAAVAAQQPLCTFWPMAEGDEGGMDPAGLKGALGTRPTAVLAGCGLGNTGGTARLVAALLEEAACPVVLDADGLNALAAMADAHDRLVQLAGAARPVVLTPHIGEMARLCGSSAEAVQGDQRAVAESFARRNRCTVVLKSHVTVVAGPRGGLYVNDGVGNPGLAKGGSGDVLAGLIAGLLAQGLAAEQAAAAGVWLHGAAADLLAQSSGFAGLNPAGLPAAVAAVLCHMGF